MARCSGSGRWVWSGLLAGGLCVGAAMAQDSGEQSTQDSDGALELEEVVVTGTRIARRDFTAPSPISTLDREDILSSAQPTLEEALNRMPQVVPDFGRTSNNPGNGKSQINLRGLGSNRTLVMLNGRRLAPAGMGNQVDVNTLPQALVERVEIVTGGATTVYGSDAVSGVVNFITRPDFDGFELEASAYVTEEGDSEVYDGNVSWGHNFRNGRGNFTLFGGYLERQATFTGAREISAVTLRDNYQGEIEQGGNNNTPAGVIPRGAPHITFTPDGLPRVFVRPDDLYDYAPLNYLQVPLEREYGGSFLTYEFSARAESYVEFMITRNDGAQNFAPVPARLEVRVNLDNPVLAPETRELFASRYTEEGSEVAEMLFLRRLVELEPRRLDTHNEYSRLVAGLRGELWAGWDYDVWIGYTQSDERADGSNDASRSRFLQGLLVDPVTRQCIDTSGGCVPIDPFGEGRLSEEAIDFIRFPTVTNRSSRDQAMVSGFIRGEPLNTWAGPLLVALGLEWRKDSGDFKADDALFTGDSLAFPGDASIDGKERVREVYGEALIPLATGARLAQSVELEIGGRLSGYDHAGTTESYKFGGNWEPVENLRFRTMYQRSVRAPDLQEAFQSPWTEDGFFSDPLSPDPCSASQDPAGNGFAERCIAQGIPADQIGVFEATDGYPMDIIQGGNPNLIPETGKTWTAGMVYSFLEGWLLSLDFFDLSIEDAIGDVVIRTVCFDANNTEAVLCDHLRRDPENYNVVEVNARKVNLGELQTDGFDFQASYATDLPQGLAIGGAAADLSVELIWTHLNSLSFQNNPAIDSIQCAGTFGPPCHVLNVGTTAPENRVTMFAQYTSGNFDLALTWRWMEGTDTNAGLMAEIDGGEDPIVSNPSISSKNYVDLGIGYRFGAQTNVRLGIANLFETNPPLMINVTNNTDTGLYDIFGRAYQLSMNYRY